MNKVDQTRRQIASKVSQIQSVERNRKYADSVCASTQDSDTIKRLESDIEALKRSLRTEPRSWLDLKTDAERDNFIIEQLKKAPASMTGPCVTYFEQKARKANSYEDAMRSANDRMTEMVQWRRTAMRYRNLLEDSGIEHHE